MASVLQLLGAYWWLLLLFGGTILEFIAETFDVGVSALRKRAKAKRRHQVEMKRLELEIAQARTGMAPGAVPAVTAPKPGPCVHRNVVPVVSRAEEVVAWLCRSCEERLPASWAVREEDL